MPRDSTTAGRGTNGLMPAIDKPQATHVVTLVHGTRLLPWQARRPDWTEEDSSLCMALQSKLPVTFRFFGWNGGNSMRARAAAKKDLVQFLREGISDSPDAKHFIIAHSHGGNVSLHAACEVDLENVIQGVVCMATPFLHVNRYEGSDFGKPIAKLMKTSPWLVWFFCLFGLLSFAPRYLKQLGQPESVLLKLIIAVLLFLLFLGISTAAFAMTLAVVDSSRRRLTDWVDATCGGNRWPDRIHPRLLILRSVADEASGALIAAQFSRWIMRSLSRLISEAPGALLRVLQALLKRGVWFSRFGRLFMPLLMVLGLVWTFSVLVLMVLRLTGTRPNLPAAVWEAITYLLFLPWGLGALYAAGMMLGGVFACLYVVFALAGIPLALASMTTLSVAFGADLVWSAPWLDINAETTPPGNWAVSLLGLSRSPGGLRHSIYNDPRAISQITDWLVSVSLVETLPLENGKTTGAERA